MEKLTVDIAVLGTGGAGMTAAIRAAEGGAKVVILEKRPCPGGTSNTPMCVAVTKKDQEYRDKAFEVHMAMTQQAGNGPLVRAWLNKSGEIPEFLERQGYKLGDKFASATLETMGKVRGYGVGFPNGYFVHDVSFLKSWQDFDMINMVMMPLFLFSATFYPLDVYDRFRPRAIHRLFEFQFDHAVRLQRARIPLVGCLDCQHIGHYGRKRPAIRLRELRSIKRGQPRRDRRRIAIPARQRVLERKTIH